MRAGKSKGGVEMNNMYYAMLILFSFLILNVAASPPLHLGIQTESRSSSYSYSSSSNGLFLKGLKFKGLIRFDNLSESAVDFGNMVKKMPLAVLHPGSINDICTLLKSIYESNFNLSVVAKGHAHSIHGQAQAENGVVVDMSALRGSGGGLMRVETSADNEEGAPFVDVSGGELWIDVLTNTLQYGLAPRSWTDYLYLSVAGTLSNAGISGQAFRYGPQIANVFQLQIVTGKGELVTCSRKSNPDLFYSALGGLGQFGIITRARIALEAAPQRVKWIRVFYSDFETFSRDQEYLISQPHAATFDYLEGFVVTESQSLLNNWRSSLFKPLKNKTKLSINTRPAASGDLIYSLEVAKYYNAAEADTIDQKINSLLAPLDCVLSSVFSTDVSYFAFLNRVHSGEIKLRAKGLWQIPHPWLNLLIPKSKITHFNSGVFNNIFSKGGVGPVLIYPMLRSKWDDRMSAVIPDEDIFYLVALLRSPTNGGSTTEDLILENNRIRKYCKTSGIAEKMYLPHFGNNVEAEQNWRSHFGQKWSIFRKRKATYDPRATLAPGHFIFSVKTDTSGVLQI